jgi:deoxyribonuclease-4
MASMLPAGRRLGIHLAHAGGLVRAADRAVAIGATAVQVFSDNPTAWQRRAAPSSEIPAFRARLARAGIAPIAIHTSYLINLAGSHPAYHERSVALLAAELRAARRLGATIVNVHVGSHGGMGVEAGIERTVTAIGRALEAELEPDPDAAGEDGEDGAAATVAPDELEPTPPAIIALENSAGSGFGLGTDLDELEAIAAAVDAAGLAVDRVAFCLDTAHAWSAGYDLAEPEAIDELLADLDRRIGLDRLALVHLNDSKSERGSRLDRHEHLGAGRIGERGLGHLLRHPRLADTPWILETPGMDVGYDAINLARAGALIAGEPLETLPPAAFTIRGRRARATTAGDPAAGAGVGEGDGDNGEAAVTVGHGSGSA